VTSRLSPFEEGIVKLDGYRCFSHIDDECRTYTVYHHGIGPPVIIIHELAGISPALLDFADQVVRSGFSVFLPALLPRYGGKSRLLVGTVQVCVSAEFVKFATRKTSPIVSWLRSLAQKLHDDTGDRVGVVGMCLTGGFALAMAVDDHVAGPVMAHPSLPIGFGTRRRRDLGLDPDHLQILKKRRDLRILGIRFSSDLVAPSPRFDRMESEFGGRFTRREVRSGCRSPLGLPFWEHSVLNNPRLQSKAKKDARARIELERVVKEVVEFLETQVKNTPTA
jgi:dienelactone hydrolase